MISAISLFISFRPRSRWEIAGLVALMLAVTATYIGQGLLIAVLLAQVFEGILVGPPILPLAGIVALQILRIGLTIARDTWAPQVSARVKEAVREQLTLKLLALGPGQVQRMRTGDLQSTVVDSVELLDPLLGRFVPAVYAAVIGACLAAVWIITVDPLVGVIVLACALLAPLSKLAGAKWIKRRSDKWYVTYRSLYSENLEAVQGMATLKAFNASGRRGAELGRQAWAFWKDSTGMMITWAASSLPAGLLIPIGTATALSLGAWHEATGTLSIAGLFTILLLTRETFRPMQELQSAHHAAYSAIPAGRAVADLLRLEPEVTSAASVAPVLTDNPPSLDFIGLRFSYPTRSTPVLEDFSLSVRSGERVAIVGRSGAGKSSIVGLLLRYFDPQQGTIKLAGHDVRDYLLADLRALIGLVAQDTYLFHGTVRENLLLALPDATQDEIVAATTAAQARPFIEAMPQGYDTIIGERGLKLSGGERQRLAIARALLKNAPVLILDEPTSSIDAANEAEITKALLALSVGRTTITIAHRLSTVRDADRILVMNKGLIAESGTHSELLAGQGAYAELVATQTEVAQ